MYIAEILNYCRRFREPVKGNRILQQVRTLYSIYFEKNKKDLKNIVRFTFKKLVSKIVTF